MQPSTFATYTNDQLARRLSVFDLLVDPLLYNQALAPQLMQFNPFLSNVSPYGDATPNRMGVFGSLEWGMKKDQCGLEPHSTLRSIWPRNGKQEAVWSSGMPGPLGGSEPSEY